MDPDAAPELTTRKPRDSGKLVWFVAFTEAGPFGDVDCLRALDRQPNHADQADARRWLMRELEGEALPADASYALHRVVTTVRPRVQVTRKAVL